MSTIKDDAKYRELKDRLESNVREISNYVNTWAHENNDDGTPAESLFVTGWVLGIAVTGASENGEFDDLLVEGSNGLNSYMAWGMCNALTEGFADHALGRVPDDE